MWHESWIATPHREGVSNWYSLSTFKPWVYAQYIASSLITGDFDTYHMIAGSILPRCLFVVGVGALIVLARRRMPWPAFAVLFVGISAIVLDSSFAAFFNSFYEDQLAITLFPVLTFCVVRNYMVSGVRFAVLALALALLIGASKTAFFLTPIVLTPFLWSTFRANGKTRFLLVAVVLSTAVTLVPVKFGAYKAENQFHVTYYGALSVLSKDELLNIAQSAATPIDLDCVNNNGFGPEGEKCVAAVRATYMQGARLILSHPWIGVRMIGEVFKTSNHIRIEGLSNEVSSGIKPPSGFLFSMWDRIYSFHLNLLGLPIGFLALWLCNRQANGGGGFLRGWTMSGIFLLAFGYLQCITVLGDGLYELQKHLLVANYSISFALVIVLSSFIASAIRARARIAAIPASAVPQRRVSASSVEEKIG